MGALSKAESLELLETYRHRLPLEGSHVSLPVPNSAKPGHSPVYRNATTVDSQLMGTIHPRLADLDTMFRHCVNLYGNDDALGFRKFDNSIKGKFDNFYSFYSYNETLEMRDKVASGLVYLVTTNDKFVRTEENYKNDLPSFVCAIYSENRWEWLVTDLACSSVSLPSTVLYDTLGPEASRYILEVTESPVLFVSGGKIPSVLNLKRDGSLSKLLIMISYDSFGSVLQSRAQSLGVELIHFSTLMQIGATHMLHDFNPPSPETVHTICFTSGTTGKPKGVVLHHRNTIAQGCFIMCGRERHTSIFNKKHFDCAYNRDDNGDQFRHLCSLPLAHIYERGGSSYFVMNGVALGFPSQGMAGLFDDWRCLRPHHISSVPRVWNRVESEAKLLLERYNLTEFDNVSDADKLLLRNVIRDHFGLDRCRDGISGSAPLARETVEFISEWLCIGFNQGYGTTETYAGMCCGNPFLPGLEPHSVGPIGVSCEMRLCDVPRLNYLHTDKPHARGELLIRGEQIFSGYYKRPELNEECFDEDGFYRTGDVAAIDERGNLYIIDRVKNFFKLAQGEFVTPERIENIYLSNSRLVQQIFVHGDSLKNYLVGVVGINPDTFREFLSTQGINVSHDDMVKFFTDPKVKKKFIHEMNKHVNETGLQGFEKLHNVHVAFEPFTIEDDVLTPTLKLKREVARSKFKQILEKLYEEGSLYKQSRA